MKVLTVFGGEAEIAPGDFILVPVSANGTQVAVIKGFTRKGAVRVYKYRKNSGQWTNAMSISPRAILQKLERGEARRRTGPWALDNIPE